MTALLLLTLLAQAAPNPAFAPITDEAGLPRVLLIGDSISIGYTLPVRELLKGQANVHRIPENAAHTNNGVAKLEKWLGDKPWDLIHFNFGLHDLRIMDHGKHQVAIEQYEANLRTIVARLKQTGARLIWCSTTPVPEGKVSPPRNPADVTLYNAAARRVMEAEGIAVDDLYAFALPRLSAIQRPANVHYTDEGSRVLAGEVARVIGETLTRSSRSPKP
ncbi:MAG: SGNH/GDSL hydrolase family protein [Bryobacter sp.]|nr:SGNH/GDSL hydrolase family protein [Bryobacter sp.]